MEPFEVYRVYLALKLHFTTKSYDITKTLGAVTGKRETFLKRKDLTSIRKLARDYTRKEIIDILVANFANGDKWGGVFDSECLKTYKKWLTNNQRMLYNFNNELDAIIMRMELDGFSSAIHEGAHPIVFKMYMGKEISLETLAMLEKLRPYVENHENDFVLEDVCLLVSKYKPFVKFDKEKISIKHKEQLDLVYGNEQI